MVDLTPGYRGGAPVPPAARSMLFAGTVIGLIGVVNFFEGVAALSGSRVYPKTDVFEFGDLRLWGWLLLLGGVLEVVVSFAIFTKNKLARTLGIAVVVANAFVQLAAAPGQPWWFVCAFAADVFVIKALVAHGGEGVLD